MYHEDRYVNDDVNILVKSGAGTKRKGPTFNLDYGIKKIGVNKGSLYSVYLYIDLITHGDGGPFDATDPIPFQLKFVFDPQLVKPIGSMQSSIGDIYGSTTNPAFRSVQMLKFVCYQTFQVTKSHIPRISFDFKFSWGGSGWGWVVFSVMSKFQRQLAILRTLDTQTALLPPEDFCTCKRKKKRCSMLRAFKLLVNKK